MDITLLKEQGQQIAVVAIEAGAIASAQDVLDTIASAAFDTDSQAIVLDKQAFAESCFDLSTQLLGEALQKFVNYRIKLAIVGDFSGYASKSLQALIRESNRGRDVCFASTQTEAIRMLLAVMA